MRIGRLLPCAMVALSLLGGGWLATPVEAQAFAPAESVTVALGPQFKAGALRRFFFGTRYRDLWTTPIRIPVLRLEAFGGGLKPTQRGGGMQTRSLRLVGPDGRQYQFRSVDKDPTAVIPAALRNTVVGDILRDQTSAQHPAGALIVPPLLSAAEVLHTPARLVRMADDPALGEFRQEFGGMIGTIEERPRELANGNATFPGATEIVSSARLMERLPEEPAVGVDARAFLVSRLTDVFLGDWDRHQDQWRWARVGGPGAARWLPIPRDRDQAFALYDGFIPSMARRANPQILHFRRTYAPVVGATWNGRDLDRRILVSLERPVWDSVASALKTRLNDRAIAEAMRRMPPEYQPLGSEGFEQALRSRRDAIPEVARSYYELLSGEVDVHASNRSDSAGVIRFRDGSTVVTLSDRGHEYFRRRFLSGETRDIRVFLDGGDDVLTVEGEGGSSPTVRVIGGEGNDRFIVGGRGGIHLYDQSGDDTAVGGSIQRKPWTWKPDTLVSNQLPPRDWGRKTMLSLSGSYASDLGAVISYGGFTDWFGFRRIPYATRADYRLQYSTAKQSVRLVAGLERLAENSPRVTRLEVMASGIETLRWYGQGNQTARTGSSSFYKLNQNLFGLGLRVGSRFGRNNRWSLGPEIRWSHTNLDTEPNSTRFIATDRPYGSGRFGMVGAAAELKIDGRNSSGFPTSGAYLLLKASGFPKAWDLDESFGKVEAEAAIALAPQGSWRPSLNLMVGAVKTFGDRIPFFETARLGGLKTLRGYSFDRFAGEASVYGSAEVRLPLTRIKLFASGQQGVFGFYDAGRVYVHGEVSDEIHTAIGGGLWISFFTPGTVGFVGVARPTRDKEGNRIIAGFGFPF